MEGLGNLERATLQIRIRRDPYSRNTSAEVKHSLREARMGDRSHRSDHQISGGDPTKQEKDPWAFDTAFSAGA